MDYRRVLAGVLGALGWVVSHFADDVVGVVSWEVGFQGGSWVVVVGVLTWAAGARLALRWADLGGPIQVPFESGYRPRRAVSGWRRIRSSRGRRGLPI